jgi:hypothetical protein
VFYSFPASPNKTSTVLDINVPEGRATAQSVQSLIDSCGAACAPIFAGIISEAFKVGVAILWVGVSVLMITAMVYVGLQFLIKNDITGLRTKMKERAALQTQTSQAKGL